MDKPDLHCHSTASDGALPPEELVRRAIGQGVTLLALTDHDSVAGIAAAQQTAVGSPMRCIPGIELSSQWQGKSLHIVGLNIDPDYPPLRDATQRLRTLREERAQRIAAKLDRKGIPGAYEAVSRAAGAAMITRSHFADFLVANFHVADAQDAFDRYLARGKPAYAETEWTPLAQAVEWIRGAGGVAVLAHPLRYKLTASWMRRLLAAFKDAGGQGIEVVAGRYNPEEITRIAAFARQFDLYGSVGSDFHTPNNQWLELGRLAPLPEDVKPVWALFG